MLRDKIITINNNQENLRIRNSIWHKLLPVVLILSFMWLGFYQALCAVNLYPTELIMGDAVSSIITELVISGLVNWIIFEIAMWIYRFALGFSIYTFIVPSQAIKDNIKWCFILRNIVMGGLYFLCIYFPYISSYLIIIDLICMFLVFVLFALRNTKMYVETIVRPFAFKGLMIPFIVYEFINVGLAVVRYFL